LVTGDLVAKAEEWFEHLRQTTAAQIIHAAKRVEFYQTISIGWVASEEMPDALGLAMMFADKALYRAKHQGRNCVVRAEVNGQDGDIH
jgi:PleD family two-component response regulator